MTEMGVTSLWGVLALTLLAGLAMPLGAVLASVEKIRPLWLEREFRHSILAFGGGALLAAVMLVLVPQGMAHSQPAWAGFFLILGGLLFMALDWSLYNHGTPASQFLAMLADFLPESIALGAVCAVGGEHVILLAVLIGLQNVPEGFNAYRELHQSETFGRRKIIYMFALMALLGPVAGAAGYLWLSAYPQVVSAVMLLATGGILYSVFQDIAPQAKMRRRWAPAMGAILGFSLGVVGQMLEAP
jgi:zinc transporter, ZIP family